MPKGAALLRAGARPGDDIWVSGTLGDAALGLAVLQAKLEVEEPARENLIERYRLPSPRPALGQALRGLAHAAIDISDGLLADLGHIVEASEVGADIHTDLLPLSDAAKDLAGAQDAALSGGDDYELLFTAPPSERDAIKHLVPKLGLPLTRIGAVRTGSDLRVVDANGRAIEPTSRGWQHF